MSHRDASVTVTVVATIQVPAVPRYLFTATPSPMDPDLAKLDIADFSDAQLEAVGRAWTAALKAQAALRRTQQGR